MTTLGIDIETYCDLSLKKVGMHRYINHPSFEILLFAYSIDFDEPVCIDLAAGEEIPPHIIYALQDPNVIKTAWNAPFEYNSINKFWNSPIEQWHCTMVRASMLSYPLDLEGCGKAMKLEIQKDKRGKALIREFTMPCKPTKNNGYRVRNYPEHNPVGWLSFKQYNIFDVRVEQAILSRIQFFKPNARERQIWLLDQKINQRGVRVDRQLVQNAIEINERHAQELLRLATDITGLKNANSVKQLKEWLEERMDEKVESLTKENIKLILEDCQDDVVRDLLEIRQQMSKSSVKKYRPMDLCTTDEDDRAHGLFQYNGANKTGRWASRIIQLHNLVRNKMKDLDLARQLVKNGDKEGVELLFGNVTNVMSELCRTAFVASPGKQLGVSDFSAIEARGTAWFADEEWRMEVFKGHGKIYEASGAEMFKIPIEEVVGSVRDKSKVAELALGYQGAYNAMIKMGALKMGIKEEEIQPIVDLWRKANPHIVKLWYNVEKAAIQAVNNPGMIVKACKCKFFVRHNILFIQLPSGRFLTYVAPHMKEGNFNKLQLHFYGLDQKTRKWCRQQTYGGKLVENIVQGFSRDLLADKMVLLDEHGYDIVMHVHDEIVLEIGIDETMDKVDKLMSLPVSWAPGLPLGVKSFTTPYYIKD